MPSLLLEKVGTHMKSKYHMGRYKVMKDSKLLSSFVTCIDNHVDTTTRFIHY